MARFFMTLCNVNKCFLNNFSQKENATTMYVKEVFSLLHSFYNKDRYNGEISETIREIQ